MRKAVLSNILFLLIISFAFAQEKDKKWDVNNPPGNYNEVSFDLTEGTWMNLDVSPDGNELVFDLLGDIYTMPIGGGEASVIREGLAWEVQPRYSPDGKKIMFTSDAGGGDNIWVMAKDGSDAKQVTKEDFRLLNNPEWMPDGQYFVARKHFTSTRSLGAGEIWMYHINGGKGIQITERKNDQQDVNEPTVSSDGRYIYFSEDEYPGGYFQYNKDPNDQIFVVKRYDREKSIVENVITGPGGAARPQISNDGNYLAYIKRVRTKTVLVVHNLKTGEEYHVFDGLSKDQQEAWTIFGIYTGFSWTPDDQRIIIWGKGKIWSVDVKSKQAKNIPFKLVAKHKLAETVKSKQAVDSKEFDVNVIRHMVSSPDGKLIVFNALGYLWKKNLKNGKATRLTESEDFEFDPSFSPDGNKIVYVSWNDQNMGTVNTLDIAGGSPKILTTEKGIYRTPSFSFDGKQVIYQKTRGNQDQGFTHCKNPGIYLIGANGGTSKFVHRGGSRPSFNKDATRIFFETGYGLKKNFKSIKVDGTDEKILFKSTYAKDFTPSPDNEWVAFRELFKVFIAPFPKHGKTFELNKDTKSIPTAQVAKDAGRNLHWSKDSKKLIWTLGNEYFSEELTQRFLFLEGAVDSIPPIDSVGMKIELTMETDHPEGFIVLDGGRIITMEGDEVIENGVVVIKDHKIEAVGKKGEVRIPSNAKTIDCTGKTIMPGLVDVHAHLGTFRLGLNAQKYWPYYANLAYGVTTTHDPSTETEMTFAQAEMVKSGIMVGPRIYSTGRILYGADGDFKALINSLDDARSAIRRTKAFGSFSVKSYNQPRRDQRQQVIQAARELDIMVYPEGGSFFYHNMTMVVDGHTGVEHNIPVAPLYDDVIQLWSKTKTGNTPTLIVNYGGINGEYYWYQNTKVWEKERVLSFMPRSMIDSRSRHRTMIPDEEYENGHILVSKSCKKLQDAGVKINLGSHGQLQGLGAHWELWMLQQGGMSNMQALRAATMNGAEYIGMDAEIGSIKAGKLADIIVLDKNPLDDIQNSEFVKYTMINGRLYDSATMDEIGNYDVKRTEFYWEKEGSGNAYPFYNETGSFMRPVCSCRQ